MGGGVDFDKDNLDFEESRHNLFFYIKKGFKWFVLCSLLAVCYYALFSLVFSNEQERKILKESRAIEENLAYMEEQMRMLEGVMVNLQSKDREIYENIFHSEPPHFALESSDYEAFLMESDTIDIATLIWQASAQIVAAEDKMVHYEKLLSRVEKMAKDSLECIRSIPSIIPIEDFSLPKTGATVGKKMHPFYKTITEHTGLDLITSSGSKVIATANGVVLSVEKSQKGKGNQVVIDHGNGYRTTYSHLSAIMVKKGQRVHQRTEVGRVGTSGTVFAPHLHYEVIFNGEYMNPIDYFFVDLNPLEYREMMMIAVNTGQSLD